MVIFRLAKIGAILKNRSVAGEIREEVKDKLEENERVVLDFSNVEGISRAFAQELVGKLIEQLGIEVFARKVVIENVSSRVARILEAVLLPDTERK